MDAERAHYVLRYYGQFMTTQERLAQRHLMGVAKATRGRTDAVAQREAKNSSHAARELLSDDPEVLQLATNGIDTFTVRAAQRILDEHSTEIAFNYCPRCGALAKTPKARQCRVCRHDWHSAA
jgi:tRNA(Ile2) C34 agmatinyltransferase TiaS